MDSACRCRCCVVRVRTLNVAKVHLTVALPPAFDEQALQPTRNFCLSRRLTTRASSQLKRSRQASP